jgi:hypothetical protein
MEQIYRQAVEAGGRGPLPYLPFPWPPGAARGARQGPGPGPQPGGRGRGAAGPGGHIRYLFQHCVSH